MWWSKNGFVDISKVSNENLQNIISYWFEERRPYLVQKIYNAQLYIKQYPRKRERNISFIVMKNMHRSELVQKYDTLIMNEVKKRS